MRNVKILLLLGMIPAMFAQDHRPLYKVTIVSRTTKAVNYGHRAAPTTIGFAGTPLLSDARGKAVVEAKPGATVIQARFSKVPPPTRFGAEYLTYVLWAISPDGRPQNLGEVMLDGSDKGKLTATTNLQTFALVVTAEPHFSVAKPSDVVVMENVVSPETVGKVEEVNATYELLPRKGYTYDPQANEAQTSAQGKPVSRGEYDLIVALYQAQNAIQMAEAEGAAQYAPERLERARQLAADARGYSKASRNDAIATAREATQVAEDARRIAAERGEADRAAKAQQAAALVTPVAVSSTQPPPEIDERSEEDRVETGPAALNPPPSIEAPSEPATVAPPPRTIALPPAPDAGDARARENRSQLASTLNRSFQTMDTPRGVVVTLPSSITTHGALPDTARRIAAAVQPYPGLHLEVDAHSDRTGDVELTREQADAVRQALESAGIPGDAIVAQGFGNTRPLGPSTKGGPSIQNQRIEVVVSGAPIGTMATWDRSYVIKKPAIAP